MSLNWCRCNDVWRRGGVAYGMHQVRGCGMVMVIGYWLFEIWWVQETYFLGGCHRGVLLVG